MSSSFYSSSGSDAAVYQSAQDSADSAETSATEAAASLAEFKNLYMGAFQTAPTALQDGSLYYNENNNLLYYWNGTAWTATNTSVATTDDLVEGTTNLFVTDERIDDRVDSLLTAGSNITLTYNDAANTLTIDAAGGGTTLTDTDDLTEGATNLYYTDARVDARITAAGHITASSTDTLTNKSGNISQWTNDSGYLTSVGSLYDLSNVNGSASPSDGQVLAWDNANSYWTPVAASSGGGGIALTDLSATTAAAGTTDLSYNGTTGVFTYTPPDLSGYATTASLASVATSGAYADITGTPTLATVATSGAYSDLTGTPSLSGYLTDITAENLSDLSDVDSTAPTDGQVLTWDNANSYWKPASGGSSIDYAAHGTDADSAGSPTATGDNALSIGYGAAASGDDSISIGNNSKATGAGAVRIGYDSNSFGLPASGTASVGLGYNANPSGNQAISIGYSSNATQAYSIGIGVNSTADQSRSVALGYYANTNADNQLMLGGSSASAGFTSIRVGNTTYSPSNDMDLATKKYVDDNGGGGGGSSNIVTGTFTTTSTSYVDAGEIVDTDDGFTGALDIVLHATTGTGTSMITTTMRILFSFNSGNPGVSNWTSFPTIGNGTSFSGQIAYSGFRWDTSTNKIYLQVKNSSTASTVYNWTAVLV